MLPIDQLIRSLYSMTVEEDWHAARERALGAACRHFGAEAAAWLTSGELRHVGSFTETPRSGHLKSNLAALRFADGELAQRLPGSAPALALRYVHVGGHLVSRLILRWPAKVKPPAEAELLQVLGHLAEASSLAMRLYIQRDEWLMSMGRSNRGAAALVDADGIIHAGSERFVALMRQLGGAPGYLAFPLPDTVLDEGGTFVRGDLHVRVEHTDGLYVMHARLPLPLDVLSPREQQIARALGAGKTFKSVANQCGIAVSTVANHATRIYRKLGIFRREDLVEMVRSPGQTTAAGIARAAQRGKQP